MQEFPTDQNYSVWNPEGPGKKAMDKEEEMPKEEEEKKWDKISCLTFDTIFN